MKFTKCSTKLHTTHIPQFLPQAPIDQRVRFAHAGKNYPAQNISDRGLEFGASEVLGPLPDGERRGEGGGRGAAGRRVRQEQERQRLRAHPQHQGGQREEKMSDTLDDDACIHVHAQKGML